MVWCIVTTWPSTTRNRAKPWQCQCHFFDSYSFVNPLMLTNVIQVVRSCPARSAGAVPGSWWQEALVFNMADHLCGGFDAKLAGVDVNRGQLRRGKTRKQRIIKRKNGKVSRDRQSGFRADAFQGQGKDIIADNNGGRPAGRPEQCMYRCIFPGGDGGEFYTVFRFWHNAWRVSASW